MSIYAKQVPSPINGMYSWAIVGQDGKEHELERDYKGRFFVRALGSQSPCYMMSPDEEDRSIRQWLKAARKKVTP